MVHITNIHKRFEEATFEIELSGQFNPDKFSPLWLQQNNIIGSLESEEIYESRFTAGKERVFSTPFVEIRVSQNTFQVIVFDLKSINILVDFVSNLLGKVSPLLENYFFANLRIHFSNHEKENQLKILNNTTQLERWKLVLPNSQLIMTRIEEVIHVSDCEIIKTTSISRCTREDLKWPIHLNTYNRVAIDLNQSINISLLKDDFVVKILNNSISSTNKIIETFF